MYSHVVFTGGGLSGLSYIGVIRYMQENGLHKTVHEVAGTSVGSMFAVLFAMGILAGELEEYFKGFFKEEENAVLPILPSALSILHRFGMDNGDRLVRPIQHFVKKRYGITDSLLTFRDLAKKTGINTIVCSSNMHTRKPVYFSTDTTPDVSIYDALRASMAIPIIIEPVRISGELYVDGAICDNMPVGGFRTFGQGMMLVVDASQSVPTDTLPDTFINYISIMIQMMIDRRNNENQLQELCPKHDILLLDKCPIPFMRLEPFDDGNMRIVLMEEDIDNAVAYGYTKTYGFMKAKASTKQPQ